LPLLDEDVEENITKDYATNYKMIPTGILLDHFGRMRSREGKISTMETIFDLKKWIMIWLID
jgi:hypothetical protein